MTLIICLMIVGTASVMTAFGIGADSKIYVRLFLLSFTV
jgi:hypothetical protein